MNKKDPDKIIIRMPNWIGDFVMATPLLTDLRKKFPNAEITAMCKEPLSELLKEDKDIDEVFSFTKLKSQFERKKQKRSIILKLKEGQYDLGVLTTNSFSSAWWFFKGNVQNRIGFAKDFRSFLLNKKIPFSKEVHLVETYKNLLTPLGIEVSDTLPRIFITEKEKIFAKELLSQRGVEDKDKVIGIHAGASYGPAKRWPDEKIFNLSKKLLETPSVKIVFVGDSSVTPLAKTLVRKLGDKIIDLTGTTSLRSLCSLISLFDVFVTNDSGPMHIAAALKVPLVAIFGSTSPTHTGPYKHGNVIYKNVACSPCYKRVCPIDFPCMKKIEVDRVYQTIKTLLK